MTLKLRVEITLEIEALDFIEAAGHQKSLQAFELGLRAEYPTAVMTIKERRSPRLVSKSPTKPLQRSGVLSSYADRPRAVS